MSDISIDYGKTQVFDDAVPEVLYKELEKAATRVGWHFGWFASVPHARYWHHEISGGKKANIEDVSEAVRKHRLPVFGQYVDWLKSAVVPEDTRLLRMYFNGHTFGTDGSPHTDTDREGELTTILYLNPGWKPEFGGETVIFDDSGNIADAVMPKANRLLAFPSNKLHAPRPLSKLFPLLRVVLVAKLGIADRPGAGFTR